MGKLKYKLLPQPLLKGFKHSFYLPRGNEGSPSMPPEVDAWCVEQFGEQGSRWFGSITSAHFRDDADAFHFKLRWG